MFTLLKQAQLYAPQPRGVQDILLFDGKIVEVAPTIDWNLPREQVQCYDLAGRIVAPGYIDFHVHALGGGGEQGPMSRAPELSAADFLSAGVSTVLTMLGTDGITRSLSAQLAKVRALRQTGVSAYMLTGSYAYPSKTLCASVEEDMVLIEEIVGAKVALSDHRDSAITWQELARLATQVRRGAMLAGTAGVVVIHMGGSGNGMDAIFAALQHTALPASVFVPTHVGRSALLIEQAVRLVSMGGAVDFTAGDTPESVRAASDAVCDFLSRTTDPTKAVLSSDAGGSMPHFDANGRCTAIDFAKPAHLHRQVGALVDGAGLAFEQVLPLVTQNPAALLGLQGKKGCVAPGADADLLILDQNRNITDLLAGGVPVLGAHTLHAKGS